MVTLPSLDNKLAVPGKSATVPAVITCYFPKLRVDKGVATGFVDAVRSDNVDVLFNKGDDVNCTGLPFNSPSITAATFNKLALKSVLKIGLGLNA